MAKTRNTKTKKSKTIDLSNQELVVIAAFLAGAQFRYTDTEDIAIKANEIAPGRFAWRKYKDQINIDTVRKRLWDATRENSGGFLMGSEKKGWLLTPSGSEFIESNIGKLDFLDFSRSRLTKKEQMWAQRERVRMFTEVAFSKFKSDQLADVTPAEAEKFFRIDDYVIGQARAEKIERAKLIFKNDSELSEAIEEISKIVREVS